jgi:hypothetical protein
MAASTGLAPGPGRHWYLAADHFFSSRQLGDVGGDAAQFSRRIR